ncbi:type VII secretion target [Nocardia aurantiaca]|uniref:type VII secretion target n=1 Tax=Nocardia aurantiaca TaxID=2675850 RepID=UPI0018AC6DE8|nr:type VII secretion target [Nocardia aurantiaca]
MTDILDVDLATLHGLATELGGQADEIGKLAIGATVTMPGSPIEAVTTQVGDAVLKAYGSVRGQIQTLADRAKSASGTYEDMDKSNADQLDKYGRGEGVN